MHFVIFIQEAQMGGVHTKFMSRMNTMVIGTTIRQRDSHIINITNTDSCNGGAKPIIFVCLDGCFRNMFASIMPKPGGQRFNYVEMDQDKLWADVYKNAVGHLLAAVIRIDSIGRQSYLQPIQIRRGICTPSCKIVWPFVQNMARKKSMCM